MKLVCEFTSHNDEKCEPILNEWWCVSWHHITLRSARLHLLKGAVNVEIMKVDWVLWWGESRSTKPCFFPCKAAAAGDERYLVCAAGAAWIGSTLNEWLFMCAWFYAFVDSLVADRSVVAAWIMAYIISVYIYILFPIDYSNSQKVVNLQNRFRIFAFVNYSITYIYMPHDLELYSVIHLYRIRDFSPPHSSVYLSYHWSWIYSWISITIYPICIYR